MRPTVCLFLAVASLCTVSGCASTEGDSSSAPRRAASDFASRRLPATTVAEIAPIASRVFRSRFRVDSAVSTQTRLVSRPTEVEGRGEAHTPRDRIRLTPSRMRQIAELRIVPQGAGVAVQFSVTDQRLEVSERAAFRPRNDDRPGNQTAIDRSGPSSTDRREEWVTAGRNRRTEQAVLDEIQAALASASQPASSPAP